MFHDILTPTGLPIRLTHLRTTTSDARDATTSDAPDVAVDRVHVADPAREKTAGDASTADPPDPSTSTPSTKRFSPSLVERVVNWNDFLNFFSRFHQKLRRQVPQVRLG